MSRKGRAMSPREQIAHDREVAQCYTFWSEATIERAREFNLRVEEALTDDDEEEPPRTADRNISLYRRP